jgi:hypothetical protein|tara:strand:- start:62 stop:601 length:540 start_codon:yes stop_codon:yes gene_type:complete
MSFHKDGYIVVRKLVSEEVAFEMNGHLISRKDPRFNDGQMNNTPGFYSDDLMRRIQVKLLPNIEEHIGLNLFKTFSYARLYRKGDVLKIHDDREACEISITLDLGGDKWSIWLLDRDENPVKVDLNPGDALIYRGCELLHWRAKFEGDIHAQVFFHYVDKSGPYSWAKDDHHKQREEMY